MPALKLIPAGTRFGLWTVVSRDVSALGQRHTRWNCVCVCGTKSVVQGSSLRNGSSRSCQPCSGPYRRIDIEGQRFGMLVAMHFEEARGQGNNYWRFMCDCGNEATLRLKDVRYGNTLSCGCGKHQKCLIKAPRPWECGACADA